MPFFLFLVSLLVSFSMFLTVHRVVQDAAFDQQLVASSAAFMLASSETQGRFSALRAEGNVGAELDQGLGDQFVYNQDVPVQFVQSSFSNIPDPFLEEFFQSSGEISLLNIPPEQAIDAVEVDYCGASDDVCEDLIIEWFRIGQNFQFQQLEKVKDLESDTSPINPCFDIPMTDTQRCFRMSRKGSIGPLTISSSSSDQRFTHSFRLQTDFPSYRYLIRFRSEKRIPFLFNVTGIKAGKRVPIPMAFVEADAIGEARSSLRRVREQRMVSAGLQDGLDFVHYSHSVANK